MLLYVYTKLRKGGNGMKRLFGGVKDFLLPQWMINITIVLYRFMCRGFGKEIHKPYYGNFCGPFWAVFFTYLVPVLTPFVILAVVVRLLFGKGRGERMGNAVVSSGSQIVATKTRSSITGVIIVALLAIPTVLFWAIAWKILMGIGIVLAVIVVLIILIVACVVLNDSGKFDFLKDFSYNIQTFWDNLPEWVHWTLAGILLVALSPAILACGIVIGVCYAAYLLYENGCPLIQESSPKPSS